MPRRLLYGLLLLQLSGMVKGQQLLVDHSPGQVGSSVVAQQLEPAYESYTSYAAEDLHVPTGGQWSLDSVVLFGEYVTPSGTPVPGSGLILSIHQNAAGLPGAVVFTDTMANGADPDSNGSLSYHWDSALVLNPGTYWMVFAARKDLGSSQTQWQVFASDSTINDTALWVNPGGGFTLINCPNWTEVTTCYGSTHQGLSVQLFGCEGLKPTLTGLPMDTMVCAGSDTAVYVGSNVANATFAWSNGASGPVLQTDSSGMYHVTVTDQLNGCATVGATSLTVVEPPMVLLDDDSFCLGDSVQLSASNCASCLYAWSSGDSSASITVVSSGSIAVTVTDTNGCTTTDSAFLEATAVDPPQFDPAPPIGLCEGDSAEVTISNSYQSYLWSTGDDGASTVIHGGGFSFVTLTDHAGCSRVDSFHIASYPNPIPEIDVQFSNGVFILSVENVFESYLWSYGHTTSSVQVDTVFQTPTTYIVIVVDSNGCVGTAETLVPLGRKEVSEEAVSISPNPSFGTCVVDLPAHAGATELTLYNAQGQVIRHAKTTKRQLALDLLQEKAGTYFLVIQTQHHTFTRHLILQ